MTDDKALEYITDADKTDGKVLISSFACSPESASIEFAMTRDAGKNNVMEKGNNLAFHLIQSFKPGETDAETAHRIGKQLADEVLKGKYEYVISTHIDRNHIHNHIICNAVSFVDLHKYVSNKRTYHNICRISNRICQENGLATSMPTGEKGKCYKENMEYHRGTSWKAQLKATIDKAVWSSVNYEEFLQKMRQAGYEVRQGKNLAFRAPEQKNFTNMKSLGSYYAEDSVQLRLEKNRHRVKVPRNVGREIRLYVKMTSYVEVGNRTGFEKWAKLNNLKEAAMTFNYLSENNLLNYDNFQRHITDMAGRVEAAKSEIKKLDSELAKEKVIRKQCDAYRVCRKIVEKGKTVPDQKSYKSKHQAEYQLHDSLKKQLMELGVTKIPSAARQQEKIKTLEKRLSGDKDELQDLKQQQRQLDIVRENFEHLLLSPSSLGEPEKGTGKMQERTL